LTGTGQILGGAGQVLNGVGGILKGTGRVVGAGFHALGNGTQRFCDSGGGLFHGSHHALQKVSKGLGEHGSRLSRPAPMQHDEPPPLLQEQRSTPQVGPPPSAQD
jgi:hypothetical protein